MELLDALADLAELEWGRAGPVQGSVDLSQAPVVVWRFRQANPELEDAIARAVASFAGNVRWEAYRGGRNWVIAPRRVREFESGGQFHSDSEALRALADLEPALGPAAQADLSPLAQHIRTNACRPSQPL